MAIAETALPYGIRDIKIKKFSDPAGTQLSNDPSIDLPNARKLSFSEDEDYEELRGDDRVVATHGKGAKVKFDFESGGIPLEALAAINGGKVTKTGTSGNEKKTYTKNTSDARPYFQITGRAISDSGGDVHCVLYRCKLDEKIEGEFSDGEFFLMKGGGSALPLLKNEGEDKLYEFIHNEALTQLT